MLKNKFNVIILCLIFSMFFAYNNNAVAEGLKDYTLRFSDVAYHNTSSGKVKDPIIIIGQIVQWFLAVLGIIFFLFLLQAGFLWMTASGNEDQVGEAKKKMVNALIGLIIVLAAYAIAYLILENFTSIIQGRV
ncbi:MAG: pilin [bacterium]